MVGNKIFKTIPLVFFFFTMQFAQSSALTHLGTIFVTDYYENVTVKNNLIFTASGKGLEIFTATGEIVGRWDSPGETRAVVVDKNYAYLATGDTGLRILDISKPDQPVEIGFYDTPGTASDLAIMNGGYIVIADGEKGIRIMDIHDPLKPTERGCLETSYDARAVAVQGHYAYVAALLNGLRIIDLENPARPTEIAFYDSPGSALDVAFDGAYAYLADGPAGLRIIDIANPLQPVEAGNFLPGKGSTRALFVKNSRAFLAEGYGGMCVVDVSAPTAPKVEGFAEISGGRALSLDIAGKYCYVAAGEGGIRVLDISKFPYQEIETFGETEEITDIDRAGDYCAVALDGGGIQILNIAQPDRPALVGSFNESPNPRAVKMSGPMVIMGDFNSGIAVLDIKNPFQPKLRYTYTGLKGIVSLDVNREFIFIAAGVMGFQIFTRCPTCTTTSLTNKGFYRTPSEAMVVVVDSNNAYVADRDSGVFVIDWHNSASIRALSRITDIKQAGTLTLNDNLLFVADAGWGLKVFDVSKPDQWKRIGGVRISAGIYDIAIDGNRAFLAAGDKGITIIDLSEISQPHPVETFNTSGKVLRVVAQDTVLLAATPYSIEIFYY